MRSADSKALNGGQFPMSVLALQEHIASRYVVGLYGNTMTTNPRAMDIARDVLNNVTPAIRRYDVVHTHALHSRRSGTRHPYRAMASTTHTLLFAQSCTCTRWLTVFVLWLLMLMLVLSAVFPSFSTQEHH